MFLEYFLIFFARVCDVSLSTLRMMLVVRGKRYPAACIGFVEASIYIIALTRVVRNIDDPLKILAYGLGFSSGTILGSFIEERLAIGHVSLEIIPNDGNADQIITAIREAGFGVTAIEGKGMTGEKTILFVSLDRKALPRLNSIIQEMSPGCFVATLETRSIYGGVIPYRRAK
jgi:uncharacterized protein YebE (UPF0316 family)